MGKLEDALHAVLTEEPRAVDPRAFASDAGGCARAIWYRSHGVPVTDPVSLSTLVAFTVGNALHEKVAAAYKTLYGSQCQTEVSWEGEHIAGRADVVMNTALGIKTVVEVKSISPFEVKYLKVPKREHLLQVGLYALALSADYADIVYLNKVPKSGESPFVVFADVLDATLLFRAEVEMARLQAAVTATTLPVGHNGAEALDPRGDHWMCRYCKWATRCTSDGMDAGEVDDLP